MTKEEILKDRVIYFQSSEESEVVFAVEKEDALQAMDEYARQEVVAALNWITRKDSPFAILYGGEIRFITNDEDLTIEQLYKLYLKSKELTQ